VNQTTSPVASDQPAESRARDLAQLIHTGDRAAARAFVERAYAPDILNIPMDFHLGFFSNLHDQTRGVAILDVRDVTAANATIVLRGELTGIAQALVVNVEADPPHRITGIFLRPVPQPAPLAPPAAGASLPGELGAWLQRLADADVFSGAVALAHRGTLLFAHAYGQANKDFGAPNTTDTAFNLGSMNKMFTAVAIAQLVERGRLRFDDTWPSTCRPSPRPRPPARSSSSTC
jgi:hypothetical protein